MYSRRELARLAAAALPVSRLSAKSSSIVGGVVLGVQTWSFRELSLDDAIRAMTDLGLSYCEMTHRHVEPWKSSREELRKWRLSVPLDQFREIRRKFDKAGIILYAYNLNISHDFTDEELARGFEMARALGVSRITTSSRVSDTRRIDSYASKAKITVGMHNHALIVPDQFARPEDFDEALRGASPYIAINLDVGHFAAAGFDPVDYIEKHHEKIVTIHLKDRTKEQQFNVEFGQGTVPVAAILRLLKNKKYKIPTMIEYEYRGQVDTVGEVRKAYEYCRKALG